jgi:hypothetical protein
VGLFRRKPLHERLLKQAGLDPPSADDRPVVGGTREPGVHGIARRREWDAVGTVQAPGVEGKEVTFDVLPDRTVLVDEEEGDAELSPFADAIERELDPPYRARAVRQGPELWAVAARSIEVVELRDQPGEKIELSKRGDERTLIVDGAREFGTIAQLEQLGSARSPDYAVRAERLDGDWWEVSVDAL